MSYSLMLDTTSKYLVVGLGKDDIVIDEIKYECWQRQSEFAVLEINKILERNSLTPKDINTIIVSNGPGSYTGVRIALTIAKVWTITTNVKVKALSSLQTMCGLEKAIALLDARSNRFYIGIYNNGVNVIDDTVLEKDEILNLINKYKDYKIVGDSELLNIAPSPFSYSKNMLDLSKITEDVKDVDRLIPVYLKEVY